jgi:vacuolar-type H+-ATPase subunit H
MFGANETKDICGQRFRTAKNGVDEAEVSSFINNQVKQNSELRDKLENFSSLMKFAQRMVDEAKAVAEGLRTDAAAEAQARADSIVAEAERAAEAAAETIMNEANDKAHAETLRLHEEVEQLRAASRRDIEREMRERFETVCSAFLAISEVGPAETAATAPHDESAGQVAPESMLDDAQTGVLETDDRPSIGQDEDADSEYVPDAIVEDVPQMEDEPPATVLEAAEMTAGTQEPVALAEEAADEPGYEQDMLEVSTPGEAEAGSTLEQPGSSPENGDPLYEGTVKLKIPPPVSLLGLMMLHRQIKENPDIRVGHVTGSAQEGASMELHLPTRIPLLGFLRSLQGVNGVSQVQDVNRKADTDEQTIEVAASTIQLSVS